MTARSGSTLETDVPQILQAVESPARRHHGPTDPEDAPALIVIVGLPVSGKSTFCRRLREEIGAVILESDALRRLLLTRLGYSAAESRRLELRSLNHDLDDSSTAGLRVYRMMAATAEEPSPAYLRIDTSDAIDTETALRSVVEACEPLRVSRGKDGRQH